MKRFLLLLVPALAFALGAGAVQLARFPYVPDRLNQTVNLTQLEVRCFSLATTGEGPEMVNGYRLVTLRPAPGRQGLYVSATVRPIKAGPPPTREQWEASVPALLQWIQTYAENKWFVPPSRQSILVGHGGVGEAASIFGEVIVLPESASGEESRALAIRARNTCQ